MYILNPSYSGGREQEDGIQSQPRKKLQDSSQQIGCGGAIL
jgi:hypothetical protein